MASKLFLRNTQTHGITDTGDGQLFDLSTTAGASVDTAITNTTASGTEIQLTKTAGGASVAWISGRAPSGGFTLTNTDISLWQVESNMNANIGGRYRVFKRAANGTVTEIGGGPFDDGVEMNTADREDTWPGNVTDTAFAEDDRILIRVYLTNVGTMASGHTGTLKFNAADAATGDSFFNIAETVTFKPNEISVALSGVEATSSLGTLGVSHDQPLTGNAATASPGTVTPATAVPLTGNQITGALGTLTPLNEPLFVHATFTGTDGTDLTSYTPEIGGAFVKHSSFSDALTLQSNRAGKDSNTATTVYYNTATPGQLDMTVEGDIVDIANNERACGIGFRISTSADHGIYFRRQNSTTWQFLKIIGGSPTSLETIGTTFSANKVTHLAVRSIGNLFYCFIDHILTPGSPHTISDSEFSTVGKIGIRASNNHLAAGYHVDNLMAACAPVNIEVALTGTSATAQLGNLAVDRSQPLSGHQATGATGNLTPTPQIGISGVTATAELGSLGVDRSQPLTSNTATAELGTLSVERTHGLSGVSASLAIGNLTPGVSLTLSGHSAAAMLGILTPDNVISLFGLSATGEIGSLGVSLTVPLTGNEAQATIGSLSVEGAGNVTVALTGVSASVSLGTMGVDRSHALTGTEAQAEAGNVRADHFHELAALQAAASVGDMGTEHQAALAGVEATGQIGSLAPGTSLPISGNSAQGEAGSLSVSIDVGLTGVSALGIVGSMAVLRNAERTLNTSRSATITTTALHVGTHKTGHITVTKKYGR